jgi:hypothetical protein
MGTEGLEEQVTEACAKKHRQEEKPVEGRGEAETVANEQPKEAPTARWRGRPPTSRA